MELILLGVVSRTRLRVFGSHTHIIKEATFLLMPLRSHQHGVPNLLATVSSPSLFVSAQGSP
jgi:hypothetical protein